MVGENLKHIGLRHVALNVLDAELMTQFYLSTFNYQVVWQPDEHNFYLSSGSDLISLHQIPEARTQTQSLAHIGIMLESEDQVDEWYEAMLSRSVKIGSQPKTHHDGARSFYCFDPEDNVIQLVFHPQIN